MKNIFILAQVFISFCFFSQNPIVLNQKVIGGSSNDSGGNRLFDPTSSDYFLICQSSSNISGDKSENTRGLDDLWIIKLDQNNNILWDKTIGGDNYDWHRSSLILNDKIYILSNSLSGISGEKTIDNYSSGLGDYWLICLDLGGNILWQQVYGGNGEESPNALIPLSNGNLCLSGLSQSDISGNKTENAKGGNDFWILEVNPLNGSILQQKTIGSTQDEAFNFVFLNSNDELLLMGVSPTGASADKSDVGYGSNDIWIVKLDNNFSILDDKCFGGNDNEWGGGGYILEDNNYYYVYCSSDSDISGNKTSINHYGGFGFYYSDLWLIKIDLALNIIWDKSFGGTYMDYSGLISKHSFNKLLLSGTSYSGVNGNKTSPQFGDADIWMLILDMDGNIITQETYGGTLADIGSFLPDPNDQSKLRLHAVSSSGVTGTKSLPSKGGYDIWLNELDASSFLSTESLNQQNSTISVYPNPFEDNVFFEFKNLQENVTLTIYNLDGRIIDSIYINQSEFIFELNSSISNQVLIYAIKGDKFKYCGKLLPN